MPNMKSLSLTIQAKVKVGNRQTNRQTDKQTDRQTGQKPYAPDHSIRGHKKCPILCLRIPVLQSKQVVLIRSTPTYLRCIADQTRSKYDQHTLYHRPPRCTRSTYDLWRAGSSPTIFQPFEKLIPLTTTSQSGSDQSPLYFRPTYALPDQGPLIADPFFQSGRERGLIGSLV